MSSSRLDKLREKRAQIEAQIRAATARQRQQERRDDTRRKVIAGALALNHMEKNPASEFADTLHRLLDEYVTRDTERQLFGLKPIEGGHANEETRGGGTLKQEFSG